MKTYVCNACAFEFRDSENCPQCGGNDKVEVISPPPKIFFTLESLDEKRKGAPIPLAIENDDFLNYLPDRVKLMSIVGGDIVFFKPLQFIPKGSLIIEEINQSESKLLLRKNKELIVKKNGLTIPEERFELDRGEKIEIELEENLRRKVIITFEVEK